MKAALSAIGLGAILALACNASFAQATATITQQGVGNSAYAEQRELIPGAAVNARIIQVGNNNRAGDPGTQTGGILQRNLGLSLAQALITQYGNSNTASVVQDGIQHGFPAEILQVGDNNTGAITQHLVTGTSAELQQIGTNNTAVLEQVQVAELALYVTQNGSDNKVSYRLSDHSINGAPTVRQTGTQNSVSVDQVHVIGTGGVAIEQNGAMNTVVSSLRDVQDPVNVILQVGTGNRATTSQSAGVHSSTIIQSGDYNDAIVSQSLGMNTSLISQIGNNNAASVTQTGTNTAYIRQVGDGFTASITQNGTGNRAGIYQH